MPKQFGDKVPQHIRDAWPETESSDSLETGQDIGGTSNAEAWWAECFPQWKTGEPC